VSYQADRERHGARPAPHGGRTGAAYRAAVREVRARAQAGEPCYFCGGGFDWGLHYQHAGAFTAHHQVRIMDGGIPVPSPELMSPAHRGCNSRDGLQAQNQRRALQNGGPTDTPTHSVINTDSYLETNSREW
jgi:hypothetical protein